MPLHKHPNEQVTWIISGEAKVFSGGKQYLMKSGDMMVIPANVPHEFHFSEDTVDIDFFAPARQDWIDGTASYIQQK
ncbi:cupin domain-containing protein [Pseudoalteromonas sp. B193]